jgi:hypothetical protein
MRLSRGAAAALALALALMGLLAGCKTGVSSACDGHGHSTGYVSGWVKCSDGTWQNATG